MDIGCRGYKARPCVNDARANAKGIMSIISVIVLLLITVALAGPAWYFIQLQYQSYTSKVITSPFGAGSCAGRSASMTITNAGTEGIQTAEPPKEDFGKIGNMVPNSGFEEDANGNGKPDFWEGQQSEKHVDVTLVTDLSNSMSDCMDSQEITPDPSTVLLQHFNGNNTEDSSIWENDGVLGNTGASEPSDPALVSGKFGYGFRFDGSNDYIWVQYNDTLTGFTAMTLEAWIYINTIQSRMVILGKHYNEYEMIIDSSGTIFRLYKTSGTSYAQADVNYAFSTGKWYHLALTWSGSTAKFYVNGTLLGAKSVVSDKINGKNNLEIGRRVAGTNYFNGIIDEVAIYNRALSDNEIKSHAKMMTGAACPDDANPADKPFWCRYETMLCPGTAAAPEEAYIPSGAFTPPDFKRIGFSKAAEGNLPSSTCALYQQCSSTYCQSLVPRKVYNQTIYGPDIPRSSCLSGECSNGYPESSCSWVPRTVQTQSSCTSGQYDAGDRTDYSQCKDSCAADEHDAGVCSSTCSYIDRTECSTPACPPGQDSGDQSVMAWRASCLATECDTGITRYTAFGCNEGSCHAGQVQCSECTSCSSFETCCCEPASLQHKCEQKRDYCCTQRVCRKYSDKCCSSINCRVVQQECCDPIFICSQSSQTSVASCALGFNGGRPSVENECGPGSDVWLCSADGGSCYICGSVAVRLAKKLDKSFVDSVFFYAPQNAQVGLVSYGTAVDSSTGLKGGAEKDVLANGISSYHADKGETCIACAIANAETLMLDSAADKKYVVLMSDGEANVRNGFAATDQNGDGSVDAKDDAIAQACHAAATYGIIFYTVGFGKEAGASTLEKIAECSAEGKYFQGTSPQDLEKIYEEISQTISNSALSGDKVYGSNSMLIRAEQDPPAAESARFEVYHAEGETYSLSFYRKLDLRAGYTFRASVNFFDSALNPLGTAEKEYNPAVPPAADAAFQKDSFDAAMPENAVRASVKFEFIQTDPDAAAEGSAEIDDVYFGPKVACTAQGTGWVCGDLTIEKTGGDGDLYPYIERSQVSPKGFVSIKDANCHGDCEYKVSTISSVVDAEITCQ